MTVKDLPQISLKAARVNAGYTIHQAAKELGISHGTLVKWEKQPGGVTVDQQRKIESVYNYPTDLIFFGHTIEFNSTKEI